MKTIPCRTAADTLKSGDPAAEQRSRQYRANGGQRQPQDRLENKPQTTLGFSLFVDPLAGSGTVSEIRQRLELKYCAAMATGGANGFPLDPRRIRDTRLRTLAAAGMTLRNWTPQDLVRCTGNLEGHAASVLITTLEKPIWGPEDFNLMNLLERLEAAQARALGGGLMI